MAKAKRAPLWQVLIEQGYFADRKTATGWVMAGRVLVDDRRVEKAGQPVAVDAAIRVKGIELPYVGKGGLKLAGALQAFGIDPTDRVALDSGASTGGFTDCLLQHGAARVYAIDVGYGQLAGKLRNDPRVVNLERTNLGDVTPESLDPRPSLASIDLSYLSLKQAIPMVARLLAPGGEMLCLVKPLFEVQDAAARRSGRLDDPAVFAGVLSDLAAFCGALGYGVGGVTHSPVTGNSGTREFFLRVKPDEAGVPADLAEQIERAVAAAMRLEVYGK